MQKYWIKNLHDNKTAAFKAPDIFNKPEVLGTSGIKFGGDAIELTELASNTMRNSFGIAELAQDRESLFGIGKLPIQVIYPPTTP